MKKTKIEWVDCTINPVVGCPRSCKYCYAKVINNRFNKKYPKQFAKDFNTPEFKPWRLDQLKSKKPKSIFMDSMSDIAYWREEWKDATYKAILENPQHNYIFLTKHEELNRPYYVSSNANNVFWGRTLTQGTWFNGFNDRHFNFLSIEPILGPVDFNSFGCIRQVVIGAQTGNAADRVVPKKQWIDDIVAECDKNNVSVFMKDSLREIMGAYFRTDKLIWEVGK